MSATTTAYLAGILTGLPVGVAIGALLIVLASAAAQIRE